MRLSTLIHTRLRAWSLLALGACSASPSKSDSATAAADSAAFRVALLTPGSIADQSWNGGAYAGLMRIRDSLGARVSHIQTKTPAEFEENFRQYGGQKYDLVFGHGFEFQDAALTVAPDYPNTTFVVTSGSRSARNVVGLSFGFAEPSFLAGMVAGAMTRTNIIGTIGGAEIPPVRESFDAFVQGARTVNPKVRVIASFLGGWEDVNAGKEQALAQLGRGVDVIFQNADAAGRGVIQAVREAKHAYVIGSNGDQNALAPTVTLGSVAIDLPHAFLLVARKRRANQLVPATLELGMESDVVSLVLNPALEGTIPAATRSAIDSTRREMLAGRFHMPRAPDHASP